MKLLKNLEDRIAKIATDKSLDTMTKLRKLTPLEKKMADLIPAEIGDAIVNSYPIVIKNKQGEPIARSKKDPRPRTRQAQSLQDFLNHYDIVPKDKALAKKTK